jgi:hypothetical protein
VEAPKPEVKKHAAVDASLSSFPRPDLTVEADWMVERQRSCATEEQHGSLRREGSLGMEERRRSC